MNVLVACEFSGVVRDAFRRAGHEAWSCDLLGPDDLPDEFRAQTWPNYHLECDAIQAFDMSPGRKGWDLLIAHPPCTYLANSGVRWLYERGTRKKRPARWREMHTAARFFMALYQAPVPRVCVENPVMHGHARAVADIPEATQYIHPRHFGHAEKKATGLWLRNLPPLVPTSNIPLKDCTARVHHESPGPDRWRRRSKTLTGIAEAMASQWGCL